MTFIENLAKLAVNYSVDVKPGDQVLIMGPEFAADLIRAIAVETLKAGGNPVVNIRLTGLTELMFKYANDEQLAYFNPAMQIVVEKFDKLINVYADNNTRKMQLVNPEKLKKSQTSPGNIQFQKTFSEREGKGELQWILVPYPCEAFAQEAGMDLYSYRDFIEEALVLKSDPVSHWKKIEAEQDKIIEYLDKVDKIQVLGEETDLTLSVKGRKWINCCGKRNLPDGEVYTGPIEDSINGHIRFTFPGIYQGKEIENIYLEFQNGKVVKGTATKGEDLLQTILNIDGANRIGEFAIGTNYSITNFTKNMLFDEKMGGTLHMALGNGYPKSGSKSTSIIHWDILKDMKNSDSKVIADGKVIYEAGKWMI